MIETWNIGSRMGRGWKSMSIPREGTKFKYRPTGAVFEVKKIRKQFVVLDSMDGLSQIMVEKKSFASRFEWEKVPEQKPVDKNGAFVFPEVQA